MRPAALACALLAIVLVVSGVPWTIGARAQDAPPPKPWIAPGTAVMGYHNSAYQFSSGTAADLGTRVTLTYESTYHYWVNGTFVLASPGRSTQDSFGGGGALDVAFVAARSQGGASNPLATIGVIQMECKYVPEIRENGLITKGHIEYGGVRSDLVWYSGYCIMGQEGTGFRMYYYGGTGVSTRDLESLQQSASVLNDMDMVFTFPNMPGPLQ